MQRAAIYARYSTDEQRATSVDDQIRRAKEIALNLGYEVPDDLVFSDSAITGQESGDSKRQGFKDFMKAWDEGKVQAVIVDEISRLARGNLKLAILQDKVEKTGVRLISTDGVDSTVDGWQLGYGFRSVIASHAGRETSHRVIRTMIGQLERGFMIAAPPFGYRLQRVGNDVGTLWIVEDAEAHLVKEMYIKRRNGSSYSRIARSLNERGIHSPRASRISNSPRYWRPATVRRILQNTIYRGVFVWNGSLFAKAKAKKLHKELKPIEYARPDLRLVDDDVWHECNKPMSQNRIRGGGKSVFAGLLKCGACGAVLTVATGGSTPSAYCAQCAQAKGVGVPNRRGLYVSLNSVKEVLLYAMEKLLSDSAVEEFKSMLKERLNNGNETKITELRRAIAGKDRAIVRYLDLLGSAEIDDPILAKNYKEAVQEKARMTSILRRLEDGLKLIDQEVIERQLAVNPVDLLPSLFADILPAEHVRIVLQRLFPVVKLLDKPKNFTANYYLEISPGAAFAEVSKTNIVEDKKFCLYLTIVGGASRPTKWTVFET